MPKTRNRLIHIGALLLLGAGTFLSLIACHRRSYSTHPSAVDVDSLMRRPRDIVFITATVARDTLSNAYSMTHAHVQLLPGRLKATEPVATADDDFTYEKLDADGRVMSTHRMDNPLLFEVEAVGEGGALQRIMAERDSATLYLRLRNEEGLQSVTFRHDGDKLLNVEVKE